MNPNPMSALVAMSLFVMSLAGGDALAQSKKAEACSKDCATLNTVVNAAGVPPPVKDLLPGLRFEGTRLTARSAMAIQALARALKNQPRGQVAELRVLADPELDAQAARTQSAARAAQLKQSLQEAGLDAKRFTVTAEAIR